jgi:hypothetical protein
MLTRRLQVLVDEDRYERLAQASNRLGTPVGELVRRAIDREFPPRGHDRTTAARRLLELAPPPGQGREPDWEEQKQELIDAPARRWEA